MEAEEDMVVERTHRAEDGPLIVLSAESEEELDRWDLEALTMAEDPKFRQKVQSDCEYLEKAILDASKAVNSWMKVQDFVEFVELYEHLRPQPHYDFRYQYTPSRVRALKKQLNWILSLLRNWFKRFEVSVKPETKTKRQKKKSELTLTHEINRIESLRPDRRSEYLADKGEDITLGWLAHKIEQRRLEEARLKEEEKERNIRRYRKTAKLEAGRLSEAKGAEEDMRETLKKWVQEKRTR